MADKRSKPSTGNGPAAGHDEDLSEDIWLISQDFLIHARYDGVLLRVSPSAEALIGRHLPLLTDHARPEDLRLAEDVLKQVRQMGVSSRLTLPLRQADGNIRQVAWSITPHPSGESFFAVGRDTTDMVLARQRLREAEERLAQMQQMETLGQLAGGVAHDFNNLLVPILNVLDLLQRRPQGDSDFDELIKGASRAALSARTLVRRMLHFAQRQKSEPEMIDVAKLISGMKDLLTHILPQAVQLEIDASEEMKPVKVHPNQLELSILNLAMNASDAMRGSGKLQIRARPDGTEGVEISVTDTGIGMDEETIRRATEAFFTTKGPGKGTGLGLFMAKRLADKANGTLVIRSIVGEGTEIRFWLPAASETPAMERRMNVPENL